MIFEEPDTIEHLIDDNFLVYSYNTSGHLRLKFFEIVKPEHEIRNSYGNNIISNHFMFSKDIGRFYYYL